MQKLRLGIIGLSFATMISTSCKSKTAGSAAKSDDVSGSDSQLQQISKETTGFKGSSTIIGAIGEPQVALKWQIQIPAGAYQSGGSITVQDTNDGTSTSLVFNGLKNVQQNGNPYLAAFFGQATDPTKVTIEFTTADKNHQGYETCDKGGCVLFSLYKGKRLRDPQDVVRLTGSTDVSSTPVQVQGNVVTATEIPADKSIECDNSYMAWPPTSRPKASADCHSCALYQQPNGQPKILVQCVDVTDLSLCFTGNIAGVFGPKAENSLVNASASLLRTCQNVKGNQN